MLVVVAAEQLLDWILAQSGWHLSGNPRWPQTPLQPNVWPRRLLWLQAVCSQHRALSAGRMSSAKGQSRARARFCPRRHALFATARRGLVRN